MSVGARPLDAAGVRRLIDRKMADFRHVSGGVVLRHLELEPYFRVAPADPDVRFALETGYLRAVEDELRDPVLVNLEERRLYTCPPLAVRVLRSEPPELHRPFVEGAFIRKLFRFFVPATHEGGEPWEAAEQVRAIMQRHFALQLVATEAVLGQAS